LVPVRIDEGDRTGDEQGTILAGANRNVGHDRDFLLALRKSTTAQEIERSARDRTQPARTYRCHFANAIDLH
jgi:hypothetical protein